MCYDVYFPPEPIIRNSVRIWLETVEYYSNNFKKIKDVIFNLDSDTEISITEATDIIQRTYKITKKKINKLYE